MSSTVSAGDGMTFPRADALRAAAHLLRAMQALGTSFEDLYVLKLADLLGGPHWHDAANGLADELEADPALVEQLAGGRADA